MNEMGNYQKQPRWPAIGSCAKAGHTLIEILVTLVLMAILLSILIWYGRSGERVSRLRRQADRIALDLRRAQELALLTREFQPGLIPCGYGIHFDNNSTEYFIFADVSPSPTSCTAANGRRHPNGSEDVEVVNLEEGIEILSSNASDVLFLPPQPITQLYPPAVSEALITLAITGNPGLTREVRVTRAGQITVATP